MSTMLTSDITQGLIELASDVSHDPEEQDFFDVDSYIESIPNPTKVLIELVRFMHCEYL